MKGTIYEDEVWLIKEYEFHRRFGMERGTSFQFVSMYHKCGDHRETTVYNGVCPDLQVCSVCMVKPPDNLLAIWYASR